MRLHLIDEILGLISSIGRALTMSNNIFLSGLCGNGRRSCLTLVAHMLRTKIVSPSTQRGYGTREFKKELKQFLEKAVVENKPLILLIEDHHIAQAEFLELLNSLISSSEIPGLYTVDEAEHIFPDAEDIRRENYGKSLYEVFC